MGDFRLRIADSGWQIGFSITTNPKSKIQNRKSEYPHTPTPPHSHTIVNIDSKRLLRGLLSLLLLTLLLPASAFAQSEGRVLALVEATLQERYPGDAHRLDVRVKRVEGTVDEEGGLRLDFPAQDRLPRGTTQVKLFTGSDETGWTKAGWALLHIARYDSVVIARAALRSGDEVTPGDVSIAWMETTTIRGALLRLADWHALSRDGTVFAARTIGEGRIIRHDAVRPAFAAETGATVMMRFERGGLHLNLTCKARETGHINDEIRLYSTDTGKTYRARLTAPGAATWIETL